MPVRRLPFKLTTTDARRKAIVITNVNMKDHGFATLNANMAMNIDTRCIELRASEQLV